MSGQSSGVQTGETVSLEGQDGFVKAQAFVNGEWQFIVQLKNGKLRCAHLPKSLKQATQQTTAPDQLQQIKKPP
jgi:hypothetical protein